jgi:RNA polymerase sigma factor (sigma-70 family)
MATEKRVTTAEGAPRREDDARWIKMILEGGRQESIALNEIYDRYATMVIQYIQQNSGRKEDGEDILQDALIAMALDVQGRLFRGESSLKNYLMSVVRNMWINHLRKRGRQQAYVEAMLAEEGPDTSRWAEPPKELELVRDPRHRVLLRSMSKLYQGCMAILKMFYWYDWPHKKISTLLGYPSEASVKVKKTRCMEELKRFLDKHPQLKTFLREG